MSKSVLCVSATKFADISGLSYEVIKKYLDQGRIPFIQPGKSHVKIPVQMGLAAVEKIADESAQNKNPDILINSPCTRHMTKRPGRTPDKLKKLKID